MVKKSVKRKVSRFRLKIGGKWWTFGFTDGKTLRKVSKHKGREKVWGTTFAEPRVVLFRDDYPNRRELLDTLIHETLHTVPQARKKLSHPDIYAIAHACAKVVDKVL